MLRRLTAFLYGSTPAEFTSAYGLAESVERLAAATKRSAFSALSETAAVGKVTESAVKLQRVIPMMSNSFKPFFYGRFELRDGVTVLTGRFTLLPLVKVFMTAWFGILLVVGCAILVTGAKPVGSARSWMVFHPLLMVVAGVLLVMVGKWLSRHDVAWLSAVIAEALGNPTDGLSREAVTRVAGSLPNSLKAASLVLAASGAMQFATIFLRRPIPPDASGTVTYSLMMSPRWSYTVGVLLLLLALAVWRRQPAGWWGGFAVLAASSLAPVYAMHQEFRVGSPIAFQVVFAVIACGITAIWSRWWYGQRKYFEWE